MNGAEVNESSKSVIQAELPLRTNSQDD